MADDSQLNHGGPPEVAEVVAEDDADGVVATATDGEDRSSHLPMILVTLATVLAIVATLTTWVKTQALDTDAWVEVSDGLIENEEVQQALAVYVVNELYEVLDVPSDIEAVLPRDLQGLAGVAAAALREPATSGVERLIASDRFATIWSKINRSAHEVLVRTLRDENRPGLSSTDGDVTLDLREVLSTVATDLGLSGDRISNLPDDAGQIVVFSSSTLSDLQTTVQVLDFLSWFLFLVVVALYAVAVYLAAGRRMRILRNVGLSLVVAGVIILLTRAISVRLVTDSIVDNPANKPAGKAVVTVATRLIAQTAWTGIVIGLTIAACAWLLGLGEHARAVRRVTAPATNVSAGVYTAGVVILALALWWWNPGDVFSRLVTGVTALVLFVAALVVLRQRNRAELVTADLESTPDEVELESA